MRMRTKPKTRVYGIGIKIRPKTIVYSIRIENYAKNQSA